MTNQPTNQPTNLLTHLALALGSLIFTFPASAVVLLPHLISSRPRKGGKGGLFACYAMLCYAIYPPQGHPSPIPYVSIPYVHIYRGDTYSDRQADTPFSFLIRSDLVLLPPPPPPPPPHPPNPSNVFLTTVPLVDSEIRGVWREKA
jgi:hypothetical protein